MVKYKTFKIEGADSFATLGMKVNWKYIKFFIALFVTAGLYAFSMERNEARKIIKSDIRFEEGGDPFISYETVNKLLIQNEDSLQGRPKETLVLRELEMRLDNNDMVADADVYVTLDGHLGATVRQRKPLARINASPSFYIDMEGRSMPLSPNFSARVPVVSGVTEKQLDALYPIVRAINDDVFFRKQIVGVERERNGEFILIPRVLDYRLLVGKPEQLGAKFKKYKAFYQKALKDKTLDNYSLVDLRYDNQVVGTKK